MMNNQKTPTLLVILDGYGMAPPSKYNAISLAKKPTMDRLFELYPSTSLGATGKSVGLPDNKMSGSETGHMNIGAGRIVPQDSYFITKSIKDGSFFLNPALLGAINNAEKYGGNLHVMGMMGNADSPHSDPEHFRAVLRLAKSNKVNNVFCHLFTDGRDSYPRSALTHLKYIQKIIKEEGVGKIATLSGRFYAMDRAKNWKRLVRAYDAIVFGRGEKASSSEEAIANAYKNNLTDEYLVPTVIYEGNKSLGKIRNNDSIIFFNFRSDRARQLTKLFVAINKDRIISDDMPILDKIKNLYFVAMTDFGPDLDIHTAFPGQTISATLPMALKDFKQLYIAETEKFAHITYFINGGYADPVGGEDRIMIPSLPTESCARHPEMAAKEITKKILGFLEKNKYDFFGVNFANADMVGHTGDLSATVKAVEVLDEMVTKLAKTVLKKGGNLIITSDHGNADRLFDEKTQEPYTFHTKNPVPFLLVGEKFKNKKLSSGGVLGNIAPTILDILSVEKPKAMAKNSLIN